MSAEAISETLLAEFRAEAVEHLGTIEAGVLGAGEGRAERVASLFRAFHSLKGLARVVDDAPLESLAHAAESLLGAMRAGRRSLDADAEDALIAALDEARRLLPGVGRPEAGRTAPASLLSRLEALAAGGTGEGSSASELQAGPAEPWQWLTPDEDLLAALLELVEEIVPALAAHLSESPNDPESDTAFHDDALTLAHGLGRLGLRGVSVLAWRLAAARTAERPALLEALEARTRQLARLAGHPVPPSAGADPAPAQAEIAEAGDSRQPSTLPAGLIGATADISAALASREPPQALAEALVGPFDADALGSTLAALAGDPGVVAAQHRRLDGGDGLAVLFDPGGQDPAVRLAELGLQPAGSSLGGVSAGTPSRLFAPQAPAPAAAEDTQVRVPIDVLDRLFGRVGEFFSVGSWLNVLVFDGGLQDVVARLSDHAVTRAPEITADVERLRRFQRDVANIEAEVNRLVSLIHESTLGLRVIPLESLVNRFPRMIRDTARETGKAVRFEARTGGIKIDKGMSEMLADPLMHMMRNAVDHGIEPPETRRTLGKPVPAELRLDAVQTGNRIQITVSDDGRGIDVEAVRRKAVSQKLVSEEESLRLAPAQIARFIFAAGFSTAAGLSSVSGRGVGMDVALVNVTKLGGRIDIETRPGEGTRFRLDMPLSAAIQPMLLVETEVQAIGLPEPMVAEALALPRGSLQFVNGQPAVLVHGRFLPVFGLEALLGLPTGEPRRDPLLSLVVCEWNGQRIGVEVRRILRRHEMLIREMHPRVARLPGIGGVTTLGFDRIVLVADPDGLFDLARRAATRGLETAPDRLLAEEPQS